MELRISNQEMKIPIKVLASELLQTSKSLKAAAHTKIRVQQGSKKCFVTKVFGHGFVLYVWT